MNLRKVVIGRSAELCFKWHVLAFCSHTLVHASESLETVNNHLHRRKHCHQVEQLRRIIRCKLAKEMILDMVGNIDYERRTIQIVET